ncbi:AraC-type DNA-binding protein [Imperialibacter sp. EC-SDR9]|nr:AraC family transcriptional regulator [Imperialibacter sp. 89]CAD5286971.1 AraC family transcriptional regulator [Imperialibacter sp. 75]VVT30323.1 AraC-type DNA-binding protein [Imperialibacter sp. EC-SDR9]
MLISIKNMVCNRCILMIGQELEKQELQVRSIVLGEVELENETLSKEQFDRLDASLSLMGFERIDDRKAKLIESMKSLIIQFIHNKESSERKYNWSTVLSESLHFDYNYLSNLFSSVEGVTLEQYIIKQKIERVKELLFYDELTLSEIADKLGYSSVAHLSAQFKKMTGFTPSALKKSREIDMERKSLDHISE